MQNEMRDRLIELLENCEHISYLDSVYDLPNIYNLVADYLIANGVTVQELDGCIRCKDSQQMTVTISNKLVDGVNTGWLGGNLPARFCPFCGRRFPNRRKENDYDR